MQQWHKERKQEFFYKKAKREQYRARSAYKLLEIQENFHLMRQGDAVLDLGASPGSWSQVALEAVGETGFVLGVDILQIAPLPDKNFEFLQADFTKESFFEKIKLIREKFDVVISDAAPEFSGIRSLDVGRTAGLNETALQIAKKLLKKGGKFVCKSFQSGELQDFVKEIKKCFKVVKLVKPKASQKESPEIYVVALKKI